MLDISDIKIREINLADSVAYLNLLNQLDTETIYRAYGKGERKTDNKAIELFINGIINSSNSNILVAEYNNELLGYIEGMGGVYNRTKHILHITIAILKNYCGLGIGKKLFAELEYWAKLNLINRLELSVFTDNIPAIKLYVHLGYQIEGVKKHSFKIDAKFFDEFIMAKFI